MPDQTHGSNVVPPSMCDGSRMKEAPQPLSSISCPIWEGFKIWANILSSRPLASLNRSDTIININLLYTQSLWEKVAKPKVKKKAPSPLSIIFSVVVFA